jgi:hypothetical protein
MTLHEARLHRQMEAHRVPRLPGAADFEVGAGEDLSREGLAVHLDSNSLLAPGGDAQIKTEISLTLDLDEDLALPRVPGPLAQAHPPSILKMEAGAALYVQVDPDVVRREAV